jgi:hypothetical protein
MCPASSVVYVEASGEVYYIADGFQNKLETLKTSTVGHKIELMSQVKMVCIR